MCVSTLVLSHVTVVVVDCVTGGYLDPLAVYWGVKLPGEWETAGTAFIFYIPQMDKSTNIVGSGSAAAPANRNVSHLPLLHAHICEISR